MAGEPKWAGEATARAVRAANGRLGQPESTHWKVIHTYRAQLAFVIPLSLGIFGLCCGLPAVLTTGDTVPAIAIGVAGAVVFAIGAAIYHVTAPRRPVGVVGFERGIVCLDNNDVDVMEFADIDQVRRRVVVYRDKSGQPNNKRRPKHQITVSRVNRPDVRIDDQYSRITELGDRIVGEVTRLKLPDALHRVNAGETLRFDPFTVNRDGIDNGRDTVAWSQVEDMKVVDGTLTVRQNGKWLSWAKSEIGDIGNFTVLLALAETLRPPARPTD